MLNNTDLWAYLQKTLTEKRFIHSLEVEKRGILLAGLHGGDAQKAGLAGLLHDCCHCLPPDEQLKIIETHGILLDDFTMAQPQLWHATAASLFIQSEFGISDPEVISAVRYHTTGRAGMTKLEQVVYLADLTSGDRDYPGVDEYRKLSEKSLEECMIESLADTLKTLAESRAPIVRDAWEAYNYFWNLTNKKGTNK